MKNHKFYCGDCLDIIKSLPDQSVNCCVTSPPYWGLRDYGVNGQIGAEQTPEEYVKKLVEVFREVGRVLRDDGTLWLNIGDSYASAPQKDNYSDPKAPRRTPNGRSRTTILKPKNLIGIPWRVAFALQADGWYLRSDIIWHKPNPMPESVRDRPTKAHEYIFLLSKSPQYYYDHEAIAEDTVYPVGSRPDKKRGDFNGKYHAHEDFKHISDSFRAIRDKRNKRDVWTVPTRAFRGAHFAVFPPELITPCVLAGCPEGGTVLDPFGGSGTVSMVAKELNRNSIYIDLNPAYKEMALKRSGIEVS